MEQEQWPNDLIMNLSMFFVNLDTHVLRSRPGGDSVLLRYQAHVRRDWFEAVKESSNGPLFDIAIIQEERLRDMYRTYTNTSQLDSIAQCVFIKSIISPETALTIPFSSRLASVFILSSSFRQLVVLLDHL